MNVTFFMEQHLGHRSYYENLRQGIEGQSEIAPCWVEVTYRASHGLHRSLSLLPASLRDAMIGRKQVLQGMGSCAADVIFFNTQVPAALVGRAIRRPYVLATDITPVQYDGMAEVYDHRIDRLPLAAFYKHRVNVLLMRGAARLLPWSNWTGDSLVDDYDVDRRRIEALHPGVDLTFWRPDPAEHASDKMRILFVGGDFDRKGGAMLLEAFQALSSTKCELVLVTKSEIAARPGVEVHRNVQPNTPELLALYQSSDVFVLPSRAEALGISAVEASAAGLPVIATPVGGLSEVVVDEHTGYLVSAGDVAALIERLRQMVGNPSLRLRLGHAARRRAERLFDNRRYAARVAEVLTEIFEESKRK